MPGPRSNRGTLSTCPGRRSQMSRTPVRVRWSAQGLAMMMGAWLVVAPMMATPASASTPTPTFQGVRQRRTGVRHRPRALRADVARHVRRDRPSTRKSADSLGGLLFRNVPPGRGLPRSPELPTGRSRARSRCTPTRRRPGIRGSTTNRFPTTATRTSPPVTGRSSPSTCTRRRARPASPVSRSGTPLPNGPDYLPPYPTLIEYSGYGYADPGRTGQRHRQSSRT